MRLRSEVHDRVRAGGRNQFVYQPGVTNVTLDKTIPGTIGYRLQVIRIARVSQLVENGHVVMTIALRSEQQTHEGRADEAGSASHE